MDYPPQIDDQGRVVVTLPLRVWVEFAAGVERKEIEGAQQENVQSRATVSLKSSDKSGSASDSLRSSKERILTARRSYISHALVVFNFLVNRLIELRDEIAASAESHGDDGNDVLNRFRSKDVVIDNFVVKTAVNPSKPKESEKKKRGSRASKQPPHMHSVDIDDIDMGFFSSATEDKLIELHERSRQRERIKSQRNNEPCFGFFSKLADDGSMASGSAADDHRNSTRDDTSKGCDPHASGELDFLEILKDVSPEIFLKGVIGVDIVGSLRKHSVTVKGRRQNEKVRDNQFHRAGVVACLVFSRGVPPPDELLSSNDEENNAGTFENVLSLSSQKGDKATHSKTSPRNDRSTRQKRGKTGGDAIFCPLREVGVPNNIRRLVLHMLTANSHGDFKPDESFVSFDEIERELQAFISQPQIFLCDIQAPSNNQLEFPEKLYGRDDEFNELLEAAELSLRDQKSCNHLVLLSGYPGSGKSRLVSWAKTTKEMAHWIFLSSKFEQLSSTQPLAEFFSSLFENYFTTLHGNLLSSASTDDDRKYALSVVNSIQQMLPSSELALLAEFVPSIYLLIPNLRPTEPSPPEIHNINPPEHSKNRLRYLFQLLLCAISTPSSPLLIFLDDLQWADPSVMEFFGDLVLDPVHLNKSNIHGSRQRHLLTIGCYRDDELADVNLIFSYLDWFKKTRYVNITEIRVGSLPETAISDMVSETLRLPNRITKSLASVTYSKTAGNPLFVRSFLNSMTEEGHIRFDLAGKRWIWDAYLISQSCIADNVAKLLARKLFRLPREVQEALKVAACLGVKFRDWINHIKDTSSLDYAVREGLLEKHRSTYSFVHDTVHLSSYDLIPEKERNLFHFELGRDIILLTPAESLSDEILLAAIAQINRSRPLDVDDPVLCRTFAELNLRAGRRLMKDSDFQCAYSCFQCGRSFLSDDPWQTDYELTLQLTNSACLASFIIAETDAVIFHVNDILTNANRGFEDKLDAYTIHLKSLIASNKLSESMDLALLVLQQLGEEIDLPRDSAETQSMSDVVSTKNLLDKIGTEGFVALFRMEDRKKLWAMKLMSVVMKSFLQSNSAFFALMSCRMVRLSCTWGVCKESCMGILSYCLAQLDQLGNVEHSIRWGKFALTLSQTLGADDLSLSLRVRHFFSLYVKIWVEPLQATIDEFFSNYRDSQLIGDMENSMESAGAYCFFSVFSGKNLAILEKELTDFSSRMAQTKQNRIRTYIGLFHHYVLVLLGEKANSFDAMSNALPKENEIIKSRGKLKLIGVIYFLRTYTAFWNNDYEEAMCYDEKCRCLETPKTSEEIMRIFYVGLISFDFARRRSEQKWIDIGVNAIATLKAWNIHSKWNYQNKLYLLEAEHYYTQGDLYNAALKYEEAVESSQEHRFPHEHGLSLELFGHFAANTGKKTSVLEKLLAARKSYETWGAVVKIKSMDKIISILGGKPSQ